MKCLVNVICAIILSFVLVLVVSTWTTEAQQTSGAEACLTPNITEGLCVRIPECPKLHALLTIQRRPAYLTEYLRQSQCGAEGRVPKVCCEVENNTVLEGVEVTTKDNVESRRPECITPDGQVGMCMPVSACSWASALLRAPIVDKEVTDYIARSRCGVDITLPETRICCSERGPPPTTPATTTTRTTTTTRATTTTRRATTTTPAPSTTTTLPTTTTSSTTTTTEPPTIPTTPTPETILRPTLPPVDVEAAALIEQNNEIPKRGKCGKQGLSERVIGGNATSLDEYPWMALIEYEDTNSGVLVIACAGVLISSRYVLTAGHCVRGPILTKVGIPSSIRLGEYDTSSDVDCVATLTGLDCIDDDPQTISIAKTSPHPDYNPDSADRHHDIALVRLTTRAVFTDFVKPICLPFVDESIRINDNEFNYIAAGWGLTESNAEVGSSIKQHVQLPVFDDENCRNIYSMPPYRVQTDPSIQICAGGQPGKDTCRGDSGGPLMLAHIQSTEWTVEGIVSFGPSECATPGVPGVYTRVANYLTWIATTVVR